MHFSAPNSCFTLLSWYCQTLNCSFRTLTFWIVQEATNSQISTSRSHSPSFWSFLTIQPPTMLMKNQSLIKRLLTYCSHSSHSSLSPITYSKMILSLICKPIHHKSFSFLYQVPLLKFHFPYSAWSPPILSPSTSITIHQLFAPFHGCDEVNSTIMSEISSLPQLHCPRFCWFPSCGVHLRFRAILFRLRLLLVTPCTINFQLLPIVILALTSSLTP